MSQSEEFKSHDATRQGFIPLVGLYGGPGTGKTFSALLLARGLAGKERVTLIDTEERRGEIYAKDIPGGYRAIRFLPPFSPKRYAQAIQSAIDEGAKVVVVDSLSHCWEGEGGVCDMAAANEAKSGKTGLHNWNAPKVEHRKLLQFLLRSTVPIICCIRGKNKTRIGRDTHGKQTIRKDEFVSPITEADFAFELTVNAEVRTDHSVNLTKCCTPDLRACFPTEGPITIQHGEKIAAWCQAGGQPVKQSAKSAKARFWEMTSKIHGGDKSKLQTYLHTNGFVDEKIALESLTESDFENLCLLAEKFV